MEERTSREFEKKGVNIQAIAIKAVIPAGGEGVRLRPLTYYFQKCMLPVGSSQKPLLEVILSLLRKHGIREAILLTGYKEQQIRNYFGDGQRVGMRLTYVPDPERSFGSGTALIRAIEQGLIKFGDQILIYYGDILSNINLSEMIKHHFETRAAATLAVSKGYKVPVGIVKLDGTRVIDLEEKPTLNLYVTLGILCLDTLALRENMEEFRGKGTDIMRNILQTLVKNGKKVEAYVTEAEWYDVGSIEKYEKLNMKMADRIIQSINM